MSMIKFMITTAAIILIWLAFCAGFGVAVLWEVIK
jgi:hypothetical protein